MVAISFIVALMASSSWAAPVGLPDTKSYNGTNQVISEKNAQAVFNSSIVMNGTESPNTSDERKILASRSSPESETHEAVVGANRAMLAMDSQLPKKVVVVDSSGTKAENKTINKSWSFRSKNFTYSIKPILTNYTNSNELNKRAEIKWEKESTATRLHESRVLNDTILGRHPSWESMNETAIKRRDDKMTTSKLIVENRNGTFRLPQRQVRPSFKTIEPRKKIIIDMPISNIETNITGGFLNQTISSTATTTRGTLNRREFEMSQLNATGLATESESSTIARRSSTDDRLYIRNWNDTVLLSQRNADSDSKNTTLSKRNFSNETSSFVDIDTVALKKRNFLNTTTFIKRDLLNGTAFIKRGSFNTTTFAKRDLFNNTARLERRFLNSTGIFKCEISNTTVVGKRSLHNNSTTLSKKHQINNTLSFRRDLNLTKRAPQAVQQSFVSPKVEEIYSPECSEPNYNLFRGTVMMLIEDRILQMQEAGAPTDTRSWFTAVDHALRIVVLCLAWPIETVFRAVGLVVDTFVKAAVLSFGFIRMSNEMGI